MASHLHDKTVLVTGASGDIGAATVGHLLDRGARIAAIDLSRDGLDALAVSSGAPERLKTFVADMADEATVATAFAAARAALGPINCLINGAGIEGVRVPIDQYPTAVFEAVLRVNVTGVLLGMKYAIPLIRESGGGAIVNLSSTAGTKGTQGMSAYVASKHAVIGLTRTAALEWMRHGIRVNAVCPGPINGRMINSIFSESDGQPSSLAKNRKNVIPSERFGEPREVATVLAFLLSDEASFVNGACYSIDGGISAM